MSVYGPFTKFHTGGPPLKAIEFCPCWALEKEPSEEGRVRQILMREDADVVVLDENTCTATWILRLGLLLRLWK
jgi:hypothetical protein